MVNLHSIPPYAQKVSKRDVSHVFGRRSSCVLAARVLLFCVCMNVHGCSDSPRGGAIELSWALRDRITGFKSCAAVNLPTIRLDWTVADQSGFDTWPCDNRGERRGVTSFDVPVGTASLAISPSCASTADANPPPEAAETYEAPAPIVRRVELGGIVALGAVVIELELIEGDNGNSVYCR
jgi:hypothetical protein